MKFVEFTQAWPVGEPRRIIIQVDRIVAVLKRTDTNLEVKLDNGDTFEASDKYEDVLGWLRNCH